jgi:hypothetical protein
VGFPTTVKARGSVESWLGTVEAMMKTALQRAFKTAIQEYPNRIILFIFYL